MIAILLSTYNGEKYISEQLDSILHQTFKEYTIYIRDDGSIDETVGIVKRYAKEYPDQIKLVDDDIKHRGPCQSFMWLLAHVDSDYYMFCDQDDIWLPNKIELSFQTIRSEEDKSENNGKPILIHSDMQVVNQDLRPISESLYKTMKIKPKIVDNSFNFMGVCSCGPGCSMLFNAKAKEVSLDYDDLNDLPMHDWWVAINTQKRGKVVYLSTPTMLYRQHQSNTVGASTVDRGFLISKVVHIRQTLAPYAKDMIWLRKVGYGSMGKYLLFKLMYYIIRLF